MFTKVTTKFEKKLEDMDNTTSTGNNERRRSSGLGLPRLILSRPWDSTKVSVDKSTTSNTPTSNIGSSSLKESSSTGGGPLTRTLQQIGKLFNGGRTNVSASVVTERGLTTPAITTAPRDTLAPMEESFSRSGSFGRTYSFTRCASFSHNNSFT